MSVSLLVLSPVNLTFSLGTIPLHCVPEAPSTNWEVKLQCEVTQNVQLEKPRKGQHTEGVCGRCCNGGGGVKGKVSYKQEDLTLKIHQYLIWRHFFVIKEPQQWKNKQKAPGSESVSRILWFASSRKWPAVTKHWKRHFIQNQWGHLFWGQKPPVKWKFAVKCEFWRKTKVTIDLGLAFVWRGSWRCLKMLTGNDQETKWGLFCSQPLALSSAQTNQALFTSRYWSNIVRVGFPPHPTPLVS